MRYLNEITLKRIGIAWSETISVIEDATRCLSNHDYAQPIKPYLRYNTLTNRIIAMPAFVGGDVATAGIKWIASFPDNYKIGLPRAHCVVITNDADTGKPMGIINASLISGIRTASVSGVFIKQFAAARSGTPLRVGIVGFGPIGQLHLEMCLQLLGDQLAEVTLYDTREIDPALLRGKNVRVADCWQDAYRDADIFMTCTVSKAAYIDLPPKPRSLHLNVSLRDYKPEAAAWFEGAIVVDNWEEVCREKTDIEFMHLEKGLAKEHTFSMEEAVDTPLIQSLNDQQKAIMVNPMGMAVFDIAISKYYLDKAAQMNLGNLLD
ncbi:ornithine cyclodeaminase [Chryseolinea serpens]|uniref:Ornithine cyclodeaminase n=1 Tax=Chryseolinea serpens TaxID=947013 RepID=A0A1M5XUE1_9BACT|nr:2,3-diaminopropionate biosynthesis protein SbnB [Chryseolinea serpens]SHI03417.1 ornithine cyclodeaminase [Chryseolinea serpens]